MLSGEKICCVGVSRHVNPCRSICVVSQRKGEEITEEKKERDRGERGKMNESEKQKK